LGIKYSTAKTAMKIYREEGRIVKKKTREVNEHEKKLREVQEVIQIKMEELPEAVTTIKPNISSISSTWMCGSQEELTPSYRLPQDFWANKLTAHVITSSWMNLQPFSELPRQKN
jgi:hypothetical protein